MCGAESAVLAPEAKSANGLKMRVLETQRLLLREFHQDDLKDLVTWEGPSGEGYGKAQAQRFLNFCFAEYFKLGVGRWGMLLRTTGAIVGNCGFCHINFSQKTGEVAYYVDPKHRGRGLAAEALGALIEFGFGDMGLARIEARCDPDNKSSERVMQKAGMTFERMIFSSGVRRSVPAGTSCTRSSEAISRFIPKQESRPVIKVRGFQSISLALSFPSRSHTKANPIWTITKSWRTIWLGSLSRERTPFWSAKIGVEPTNTVRGLADFKIIKLSGLQGPRCSGNDGKEPQSRP